MNRLPGTSLDSGPRVSAGTYEGLLDEIEYFNRALTVAEIISIYEAGGAGKVKSDWDPVPQTAVIPYFDTGYNYMVVAPGALQGFEDPNFDDSAWSVGDAAFGTVDSRSQACSLNNPTDIQTAWRVGQHLLLRKEFELPVNATNLRVAIGVDEEAQVFINGVDISGGLVTRRLCAIRDLFVWKAPAWILNPGGTNLLAVRGGDSLGVQSFLDVMVVVDLQQEEVPPAVRPPEREIKEHILRDLPGEMRPIVRDLSIKTRVIVETERIEGKIKHLALHEAKRLIGWARDNDLPVDVRTNIVDLMIIEGLLEPPTPEEEIKGELADLLEVLGKKLHSGDRPHSAIDLLELKLDALMEVEDVEWRLKHLSLGEIEMLIGEAHKRGESETVIFSLKEAWDTLHALIRLEWEKGRPDPETTAGTEEEMKREIIGLIEEAWQASENVPDALFKDVIVKLEALLERIEVKLKHLLLSQMEALKGEPAVLDKGLVGEVAVAVGLVAQLLALDSDPDRPQVELPVNRSDDEFIVFVSGGMSVTSAGSSEEVPVQGSITARIIDFVPSDQDGDERFVIDFEIVSMDLVGSSDLLGGEVRITEDPDRRSTARLVQQEPEQDDFFSTFDVFVEVSTPAGATTPQQTVRFEGEFYEDDTGEIRLIDDIPLGAPSGAAIIGMSLPVDEVLDPLAPEELLKVQAIELLQGLEGTQIAEIDDLTLKLDTLLELESVEAELMDVIRLELEYLEQQGGFPGIWEAFDILDRLEFRGELGLPPVLGPTDRELKGHLMGILERAAKIDRERGPARPFEGPTVDVRRLHHLMEVVSFLIEVERIEVKLKRLILGEAKLLSEKVEGDGDGTPAPGGPLTFAPPVKYDAGVVPRFVAAGDLDGDGDLDLVVANSNPGTVSVLLNNGDGTFAATVHYNTVLTPGHGPYAVTIGDLDGDGDMNLATPTPDSSNVSVLLNNGDGTFGPPVASPGGTGGYSVVAADVDGDGDLDLATANWRDDNVSIHENDGSGTFTVHTTPAIGQESWSITASDLDNDGDLDLATANSKSNDVSVLLNIGNGTFATVVNYPVVGTFPWSVTAGDLDGDGDQDLAVASADSDNVSVLMNTGNGTFVAPVSYVVTDRPASVTAGDLDLITANQSSNDVSVLLNNGDGTFAPAVNFAVIGPFAVTAGYLDGDGDLDLATSSVVVLINETPRPVRPLQDTLVEVIDIVWKLMALEGVRVVEPEMALKERAIGRMHGAIREAEEGAFARFARTAFTGPRDIILKLDAALEMERVKLKIKASLLHELEEARRRARVSDQSEALMRVLDQLEDTIVRMVALERGFRPVTAGGEETVLMQRAMDMADDALEQATDPELRVLLEELGLKLEALKGTAAVDLMMKEAALRELERLLAWAEEHGASPGYITAVGEAWEIVRRLIAIETIPELFNLELAPNTATNETGQEHTVTATATDSAGNPMAGVNVSFSVVGPNAPISGSQPTDTLGEASFTYTGSALGTDTIRAWTGAATFSEAPTNLKAEVTKEWVAPPPTFQVTFVGLLGRGIGQFGSPRGVAVREGGSTIFVSDSANHKVQVFGNPDDQFPRECGSQGSGPEQFNNPGGIVVGDTGHVWLADTDNHRIQRFFCPPILLPFQWGSEGDGQGQFRNPQGIAKGSGFLSSWLTQAITGYKSSTAMETSWVSGALGVLKTESSLALRGSPFLG